MKSNKARIIEALTEAVESPQYLSWLKRAKHLLRLGAKGRELFITAEDVVFEIITKTIEGQRTWDINRIPLNLYMKKQIWSEVSNHLKRELKNSSTDFFNIKDNAPAKAAFNRYSSGKDETAGNYEWQEFIDECYKAVGSDEECRALLKHLTEGCRDHGTGEIPGIEKCREANARKRLKRKLKKHFEVP